MARHPKKKGDENPDTNDSNDNPTGSSTQTEESKVKSGLDKLFWLRVGLAVLAGTLSALIGNSMQSHKGFLGLGIMITMFIVSIGIAKSMRIPILPTDKKKLITTGYGSYALMFIFSWILVTTITHPSVGIMSIK
ncbi:MAG: hypothetical protein D4R90_05390 [Nitrosopumilales archaeon]|nr:MAG: hypothetical protein D4R90_05390 [Nitrosopumilales archaeon]